MKATIYPLVLIAITLSFHACKKSPALSEVPIAYTFPEESEEHEATWLQWPHHHQYGETFRDRLDATWVELCKNLIHSETVKIIAYDQTEEDRIQALLETAEVEQTNIQFYQFKNDDFWVRDNGPIFVRDLNGELLIQDWGFNGWGEKTDFTLCDKIPEQVANEEGFEIVDLNNVLINEGGSVEMDGRGTLLACKSSILNNNRNRGISQADAEAIFKEYLGTTNFIWLRGKKGKDITDQHIDGFARFGNDHTIVTMERSDLLEFDVRASDIDILFDAKDADGTAYDFVKLPLTQNNIETTYGENLGYQGSYCNYYIANTLVLVPTYDDPNDEKALDLLQALYPSRTVVGIDCRNVFALGGMIHCMTQQEPK